MLCVFIPHIAGGWTNNKARIKSFQYCSSYSVHHDFHKMKIAFSHSLIFMYTYLSSQTYTYIYMCANLYENVKLVAS